MATHAIPKRLAQEEPRQVARRLEAVDVAAIGERRVQVVTERVHAPRPTVRLVTAAPTGTPPTSAVASEVVCAPAGVRT